MYWLEVWETWWLGELHCDLIVRGWHIQTLVRLFCVELSCIPISFHFHWPKWGRGEWICVCFLCDGLLTGPGWILVFAQWIHCKAGKILDGWIRNLNEYLHHVLNMAASSSRFSLLSIFQNKVTMSSRILTLFSQYSSSSAWFDSLQVFFFH